MPRTTVIVCDVSSPRVLVMVPDWDPDKTVSVASGNLPPGLVEGDKLWADVDTSVKYANQLIFRDWERLVFFDPCAPNRLEPADVLPPASFDLRKRKGRRKQKQMGVDDHPHPVSIRFTWEQLRRADALAEELTDRSFGGQIVTRAAVLREACDLGFAGLEAKHMPKEVEANDV